MCLKIVQFKCISARYRAQHLPLRCAPFVYLANKPFSITSESIMKSPFGQKPPQRQIVPPETGMQYNDTVRPAYGCDKDGPMQDGREEKILYGKIKPAFREAPFASNCICISGT